MHFAQNVSTGAEKVRNAFKKENGRVLKEEKNWTEIKHEWKCAHGEGGMLRYVCRTRMAEAHFSALMSSPLSANQGKMRCPAFTFCVICVVGVAFKTSRYTLCRLNPVCD